MILARSWLLALVSICIVFGHASDALSKGKGKGKGKGDFSRIGRAADDFPHIDANGDNKISRDEWIRRGNFDLLDANGDGFLTIRELRAMYKGHNKKSYTWRPESGPRGRDASRDEGALTYKIPIKQISDHVACAIGRPRSCGAGPSIKRGMIATGLGPRFPDSARCPGIDDIWAMSYDFKRTRESYHGGLDIPVPWGTPMLAAANGTVVAKFKGVKSARGKEVVLRHSAADTGLPMWVYTSYGHLDALPDELKIGQRVRAGEYIGPTGNSGVSGMNKNVQSKHRRPAVHFVAVYSSDPHYAWGRSVVIPKDGWWMDPVALYRPTAPYDSASVKALAEDGKFTDIPVMFKDGTLLPKNTKLIWPYACTRR
ncbi:MAG: peptidoglycan DD-metalloendopeptidase family protein [Rhodospirillaceae bacterium]|jgi:hypothetical protein|nr:peptidoglycan DD-metalloendopeptidase family protein [Rhodospirillaceae bacterium]MBT4463400.1 peptidoglycan DD-metalloendopeptidase family protein [Rhodospirillaceae bacterium]MBT5013339.1 peptidoglycan DD-metalloendopeptidase family protein [Rhodospirillaceae bacterium]MBT7357231.1 peptidoglycan DD-metalloendopeptidase family protein [Rhodospirillaceae bacterium]